MEIGIVVAEFNGDITGRMLEVAHERARTLDMSVSHVFRVPGSFDMPLAVDVLLLRSDVWGVATLGAIIKGQTKHDEVIAQATASSLQTLSVKHNKPVSLGITGPGMTERQAWARIRPVAERAIDALASMYGEIDRLK